MSRPPSDRPVRIADAALEIIAESGLHALTHRTIDARLGFPAGTTSYYARTRAELISRALTLLIERFTEAMADFPTDGIDTDEAAIDVVTASTLLMDSYETDQIAHVVLLIDLRHDPELHPLLNDTSPGRRAVLGMATSLIERCGIPDAERHAHGLVALLQGMTLARLAGGSDVSVRHAVETYWAGMRRS
ncbi:TetR/AcrR family transcriptional regulator [Serinibacter arcticus]|uniref:Transcriptional regulator, TetR family n=1 Tax=Serinibacter arcticus TaxID=1655435 RepID=A0A4Z1E350_9MICO|nr:TetR/AcrR family transcriptional regulator [Serinibacter arcticus]TGO04873.1 Transcriptional regulator, TetR family [Serinibacter arcticus]